MSVLDFDIRDYTDPNRILEESLSPRPPVTVDNMTGLQVSQDVGQYMPTQFDTQPTANNLKAVDAMMSTGTQGINLAATEQTPAVQIPSATTPAVIKPMEGVTNEDRVHAMAMVLGAVGQNNFSNVLNTAQTGLMQKEINAKKHNDALTKLTTADYSIQNGKVNYVPARYEIDSDGNYVLRSEGDRAKEARDWAAANPAATETTADIRNFEYFSSLNDEEKAQYLGLKRGDEVIRGTDGSVRVRRADGSVDTLITSEEALLGTSRGTDAKSEGEQNNADFKKAYRAARYADHDIAKIVEQIERLEKHPDRGGIFQPITNTINRVLADLGNMGGLEKATDEQLNESDNIRRTMQWFQDSGLGARGLDTPAEFMNWLKMNGGNLSMTNEASIAFLKRAIQDKVRNVQRYNEMLDDPVYGTVSNRHTYTPFNAKDPYALPVADDAPELPPGFIIQGQTP